MCHKHPIKRQKRIKKFSGNPPDIKKYHMITCLYKKRDPLYQVL